jgi:hypothetical protein
MRALSQAARIVLFCLLAVCLGEGKKVEAAVWPAQPAVGYPAVLQTFGPTRNAEGKFAWSRSLQLSAAPGSNVVAHDDGVRYTHSHRYMVLPHASGANVT